ITTLAVQLICLSSSSSTSTQQFSVASRLARPPAARRISKLPHPISLATAQTASSSPISPSSNSVTQMFSIPSDSRTRTSSSLITWPFASSFFPPGRKTVQQRTRPVEHFTSTVCALMHASQEVRIVVLDLRTFRPQMTILCEYGYKTLKFPSGILWGRLLGYFGGIATTELVGLFRKRNLDERFVRHRGNPSAQP